MWVREERVNRERASSWQRRRQMRRSSHERTSLQSFANSGLGRSGRRSWRRWVRTCKLMQMRWQTHGLMTHHAGDSVVSSCGGMFSWSCNGFKSDAECKLPQGSSSLVRPWCTLNHQIWTVRPFSPASLADASICACDCSLSAGRGVHLRRRCSAASVTSSCS